MKSTKRIVLAVLVNVLLASSAVADTYREYRANVRSCWRALEGVDLGLCVADAMNAYIDQKWGIFGSAISKLADDGGADGILTFTPLSGNPIIDIEIVLSTSETFGVLDLAPGSGDLYVYLASDAALGGTLAYQTSRRSADRFRYLVRARPCSGASDPARSRSLPLPDFAARSLGESRRGHRVARPDAAAPLASPCSA